MCQPRRWGLGLPFLLLLVVLAALWRQGGVEADLARRATDALARAGHGWAGIVLAGRDATLTGEAADSKARGAAQALAGQVSGIRRAADGTTLLAEASPFTFTAIRDGARLGLGGFAPPGEAATLVAAARRLLPDAVIDDQLKPARGAPSGFGAAAAFGLAELARLEQGTLSVSGQMLSLTGRAADFATFDALRARLAAPPAGFTVVRGLGDGDILPPRVRPFTFTAEKGAGGLVLSGFVPGEAARAAVLGVARALGGTVTDSLRVADGAPAGDWAGAATRLLGELGRLESGRAALTDDRIAIAGRGGDGIAADDIRAGLGRLPPGFTISEIAIESRAIRPYLFNASRGEGVLALSGFVPDARARAEILAFARRHFERETIDDRLQEGIGAPADFLAAVRAGLAGLSRLAPGASLSLSNLDAALRGLALLDFAREEVAADFRREVPAGFASRIEVATAPLPPPILAAPECQLLYQEALARGTIHFRTGAADLSPESRGLLDRLAIVTLRCVNARIEIAGHTDSDGQPQANAELSRRRAEVVAGYLIRAGVPASRLEAVGYGQTLPVAPNDTAENKARNRRIEFVVK
jgi:OOP family OmpA-OmpF porin